MAILHQNIPIREEQSWLEHLANGISDPKILLQHLELPLESFKQDIEARKLFAMRVPMPFVEKMEKGNPKDPLFLQVMSSADEFLQAEGLAKIHWKNKKIKTSSPTFCTNTIIACYLW